MSTLLLTLTRINLWHFVWIAVVLAVLLSLLLSELIHGKIVWEYPFAATFIAVTVASLLIYLLKRMRNLEQALAESARHRAKDATERWRTDNALRESQARFGSAFRDAAIGMALVGTDGQWLQVNPALCELVGYTEQELLATTFQAITHPDDLDADLAFVRQMLSGEIRTYQMEKRYFHKQGQIVWILLSASLVRDPSGQPLYFIGQIQDITERKQVQEQLRESEARFRAILDNSPTMIFLKDTEGRYLLVNRQFERMFHLDQKTIAGKTDVEIFPPQQAAAFQANDREVVQAGVPLQFEEEALHDDGLHTSIVFKFPLRTMDGKLYGIGGITMDITERKRADEALRESEQRLRHAFEDRERLSQDLHDHVIQSIYAIGLTLETCQYLIDKDPAGAAKRLQNGIADLNRVITQLRNYIEWGSLTTINSATLQEALDDLVRIISSSQSLAIHLHMDPPIVGQLTDDEATHVLHIVREALSNSLRHARAKTGMVSLRRSEGGLRLEVQDDGVGFDSKAKNGQGWGLHNMAARASKLGAEFTIFSERGCGTRIILDIPKDQACPSVK
jgi:PAS domain S-box-containing protein